MIRPRLGIANVRRVTTLQSTRRLPVPLFARRLESTTTASSSNVSSSETGTDGSKRQSASFFISNVLPIKLAYWDFRPAIARLREDGLMEQLSDIASEIAGHGFRIESWEISRKDGGVFLHFSYVPPTDAEAKHAGSGSGVADADTDNASAAVKNDKEESQVNQELLAINALPEKTYARPSSPGRLFLPQLVESAKKHGGFPSWLGQAWANWTNGQTGDVGRVPGHELYATRTAGLDTVDGTVVKGSGSGMRGIQAMAGDGRVWLVKGRQWTEDMNRFPSNRLRVEFDGPDVSQEMLYTLFRPYGRVADITPPAPVPSGSLRFATVSFSRLSPAATAINTLHGYSTPTNTADFTLRASGRPADEKITLSRLRLYYERPLKAHAVRDWLSSHPRLVLPALAFLIGTLSYTFFDPIRAFFVRSKLEGVWDIESYSMVKALRQRITLPKSFSLFGSSPTTTDSNADVDTVGQNAWSDRIEAEKSVERWLSEYPSTFITITGPPGSGKQSLLSRVLKKEDKPALVIDCAEIGKAKNDAGLISALAEQTGYYPVFSFLSSINGMIDLASVGLIGQKAGFSTPIDQQLRQVLEIVGGALKDTSTHVRDNHKRKRLDREEEAKMDEDRRRRIDLIKRGAWHDGRLDCIAGNGVMSELGFGEEPTMETDLSALPSPPPLMDDVAPIDGEAVPPTSDSLLASPDSTSNEKSAAKLVPAGANDTDVDDETEFIRTLPIVVLQNYAQKAGKGDVWNVLAEWGTSLVENRIAHVIVVTDSSTATKSLTRALPSKPLNSVSLADADQTNSLSFVKDKLKGQSLSSDDSAQVAKLGGRMIDLETLVYKVRTGTKVKDAVDDIILKNVVELRKAAFGDDSEDAKGLPWTRAQAWKVVSELAKHGEISYSQLLQDFPFKGAEHSLKALEEHELVGVTYVDGRASRVKPGKPVYRFAFQSLVNDPVFKAFYQIEYNTAVIASADSSIKSCETELTTLKEITADGGDDKLGVNGSSWLGVGKHSAIRDRARWLLDKMGKNVDKLAKLEKENEEMMKVLSSGQQ